MRDQSAPIHSAKDKRKSPKDVYLEKKGFFLGGTIGSGAYAKVKRGYDKVNKRDVAIKIVDKYSAPLEYLRKFFPRELELLRRLKHPNIIGLHCVLESDVHYFVVLELADGGDLLDYIRHHRTVPETTARQFFRQLCSGIHFCHERNVVHRDLKCENVLLTYRSQVKICDFGFATKFSKGKLLTTFCGSCAYASPEILQGRRYNGAKADIWSMGIILYAMIYGCLPYDDTHVKLQLTQIYSPKYPRYKSVIGESQKKEPISRNLLELIRRMLSALYTDRPDSLTVLNSLWLQEGKKVRALSKVNKSFSFPEKASTSSSKTCAVPPINSPVVLLKRTERQSKKESTPCSPIITPLFSLRSECLPPVSNPVKNRTELRRAHCISRERRTPVEMKLKRANCISRERRERKPVEVKLKRASCISGRPEMNVRISRDARKAVFCITAKEEENPELMPNVNLSQKQ